MGRSRSPEFDGFLSGLVEFLVNFVFTFGRAFGRSVRGMRDFVVFVALGGEVVGVVGLA